MMPPGILGALPQMGEFLATSVTGSGPGELCQQRGSLKGTTHAMMVWINGEKHRRRVSADTDHDPPLSPGPQPSSSDAQRRVTRGVLCTAPLGVRIAFQATVSSYRLDGALFDFLNMVDTANIGPLRVSN